MTLERRVRALAGSLILVGFLLAWLISPWFLIVPIFVGANLLQSAFTGYCPAEKVLARLGPEPAGAKPQAGAGQAPGRA